MASSMGMACGSWIQGGYLKGKRRNIGRVCCSSASLTDQYMTLRIQVGASEKEVKKAFRQLALQVPDSVNSIAELVVRALVLSNILIKTTKYRGTDVSCVPSQDMWGTRRQLSSRNGSGIVAPAPGSVSPLNHLGLAPVMAPAMAPF